MIREKELEPVSEHGGTVQSYFYFRMEELRSEVSGGYLEFIDEFEIQAGATIEPHSHDSDEFYFGLEGSGTIRLDGEDFRFEKGNVARIKPHVVHSLSADQGEQLRCFAFAVSYMPEDRVGYTAYPEDGEPHFVSTRYWDPKVVDEK